MKIVKTMQGKEFLFDNKFSKNRIGPNDRKLDSFLRFKYKFVKFFHLKKLISKKAWYRCLEHHWESRNRKPNSFEKKRLSENIRLTSKDLTLKELVIYDLIPKEYLEDFKEKYLIFKATFSNTSMFNRPQKDINDAFIKMASTRVSGSWYNLDHFGIKDSTALGGRFEYFRMEAIGLTESFFIIDKLVKLICKNEDELTAGLTEKQKETFEKFKDCTSELSCITEREAFSSGFILATRIMVEVMQGLEEIEDI